MRAALLAGRRRAAAGHPRRGRCWRSRSSASRSRSGSWSAGPSSSRRSCSTDKSIREAFRGSSELVRGRWWHTLRGRPVPHALTIVAGPMLDLRADLHAVPAVLDQPDRLADLRAPDPVRRARRHAALLRPAGARRDRTGQAAALMAAVAPTKLRPGRVGAEARCGRVTLGATRAGLRPQFAHSDS